MPRFKTSLKKNDLQENQLIRADVNGVSIVLTIINGKIYAMDSICSHEGGPLEEGTLEGYNLICPWHQGIFDVRSAKGSPDTDWVTDLNSYIVILDDESQEISIDTG
jgi:nitrite reductase/ring-hydroxylating ferredoxin subunit